MAKKSNSICCPSKDEWQVESDLEALCRAKAIEKDPARLAMCKALAKKRLEDNKDRRDQAQMLVDMGEGKNP